jgi:hypothetical protein
MSIPEIVNRPLFSIDMTPDSSLPIRILQAYRAECDSRWSISGLSPTQSAVYDAINLHQEQRAVILDGAILALMDARDAQEEGKKHENQSP